MSGRSRLAPDASDVPVLVPGDFPLTRADFDRLAGLIRTETGISLPVCKATLVYSRLAKRLRILGLASFNEYCELVMSNGQSDELGHMCAALTTNVTSFYREPHHFQHLKTAALPELLTRVRQGGRVRIWSAACSSGEEPYSIALTILDQLPDAATYDIRILATDINQRMVERGQEGIYSQSDITSVPDALRNRWFAPKSSNSFEVKKEARSLVTFRLLNLITQWPMRGSFDVIFCRNAAIYFDAETQSLLWKRLAGVLAPGGWLYIGHSERIIGPAERLIGSCGITTYRRNQEIGS